MTESVASGGSQASTTLRPMECQYCSKEVQGRYLFHHIRVHHISEFLENMRKQYITEAEKGRPLKVTWKVTNDFDEKEDKTIYACLSSDKCFMTEERGMRHFKHNPADLKKHNTQIRKLKKEYELMMKKERQSKESKPAVYFFQKALRENDPKLIEGLWRGIGHWKAACDLAISLSHKMPDSADFTYRTKTTTWGQQKEFYSKLCRKTQKAYQEGTASASDLNYYSACFFSFLSYWKSAIVAWDEVDPRLDDRYPESIVMKRDESVMDEEFFYVATKKMPMPTLESLAPPAKVTLPPPAEPESEPEPEIELPVTLPGLTKKETSQFVKHIPPNSQDWKTAWTSVTSGKVILTPEAQMIQQMYPSILQNSKVKKPVKVA